MPVVPEYLRASITLENDASDDPFGENSFDEWNDTKTEQRDPLIDAYPTYICPIFNQLETVCVEDSILELFGKSGDISLNDTMTLTNDEILNIINTRNMR